jgi:creatinine amidohydrolase/Fe(II)-dependent formamide hydrolase-like protein
VLEETTLGELRGVRFEVAVLPWGATEPHNFHLPFGTDSLEARSVAVESAGLAWERGARVIVLPTVPFGVDVQQLGIPLTLNMNPSTQAALLADREGWAWAPRRWTEVTEDSGVGDPRRASSERGAEFFGVVTGSVADFLVELAEVDLDDQYEGPPPALPPAPTRT